MTIPRTLTTLAALSLALTLLFAPQCLPAPEDGDEQPIYLEADGAEFIEAESLSIYTGNVFIRQGSMEFRGDRVTVHHDPEHRPKLITTTGTPVTYRQQVEGEEKAVEAKALRMEYDKAQDEITLIDQAVLFQGEDTFRSDRIVYDWTQARVKAGTIAKGKERVKITISPARR